MNTETICHSLHEAIEARDVEAMLSLYHDDAELRIVDQSHPPSHPMALHGKDAIGAYFRDIMGRDVEHHITDEIISTDGFAMTEECEYPDGTRVFASTTLHLRDGKIDREVEVQAWDA